jgi:chromodomain-helicase-DNA-binding protein 1
MSLAPSCFDSTNSIARHYVADHHWPNKEAGGAKLQEMYRKLMAAQKASTAKPASNGK